MAQLISSHFKLEPQNWGSISKVRQSRAFSIQVDVCSRRCGGLNLLLLLLLLVLLVLQLLLLLQDPLLLRQQAISSLRRDVFSLKEQQRQEYIEGGEKAAPDRACPAPCSLVGCRSQARRRSGSRRSCRCRPSPARSTSAKCRGRNDWRNVEILGRKSRRIYGCYGAFPSFLKKLPRLQFTCGSGKAISEPKVPGTF